MSRLKLCNIALAAAISLTPTYSFAQEVFGTLEASLDGAEQTWFLTTQDNESQSFGLSIAVANLQSFSLWGQPSDDMVKNIDGSLLLTFDVMSVAGQTMPLNVSLTYLADGWTAGWVANEADQIKFALTTLEEVADGIHLEGSFETTANYSEALTTGEVDPSRTMPINGTFSAVLPTSALQEQ